MTATAVSALSNTWRGHADTLWGYAEADSTLVGVLVVTIAALALVYVVMRVVRGRGPGKNSGSRG